MWIFEYHITFLPQTWWMADNSSKHCRSRMHSACHTGLKLFISPIRCNTKGWNTTTAGWNWNWWIRKTIYSFAVHQWWSISKDWRHSEEWSKQRRHWPSNVFICFYLVAPHTCKEMFLHGYIHTPWTYTHLTVVHWTGPCSRFEAWFSSAMW